MDIVSLNLITELSDRKIAGAFKIFFIFAPSLVFTVAKMRLMAAGFAARCEASGSILILLRTIFVNTFNIYCTLHQGLFI